MAKTVGTLSPWDYVVFSATLLVSVCIGIYYAAKARQTTEDYLLGGRKLSWISVALSMTTSFMSAIMVLGTPSEVYYYGTMYWWAGVTYIITTAVTCAIYIPVFYNLQLTSCYKYLELRFNSLVKTIGTIFFIVQTILYLGLVTYLPALALYQVTALSLWGSVLATGLACVLYSTIGGIKGIVTADCFQLIIMLIGLLAVLIRGTLNAGGIGKVMQDATDSGNIIFIEVSFDPRVRHTVWSFLIGGSFAWVANYSIGQSQVQRYLSCRSQKDATKALVVCCFLLNSILALVMLIGLVCVSYFMKCDPILTGKISRSDEMVALMVVEQMSDLPGMTGLIISAAYSGTLSSVSTGIHSMGCVVLEDFFRPCFPQASERCMTLVSKGLTVLFGLLTILVAFGASKLDFILQAALSVWGVMGGPLVGVFTLGVFFPFSNAIGALSGQFCGFCVTLWVAIGAQLYKSQNIYSNKLATSTEMCDFSEATNFSIPVITSYAKHVTESHASTTNIPLSADDAPHPTQIYFLSYLYYGILGASVTVFVGLIVSAATGLAATKLELLCPPARIYSTKFLRKYVIFQSDNSTRNVEKSKISENDICESVPLNHNVERLGDTATAISHRYGGSVTAPSLL